METISINRIINSLARDRYHGAIIFGEANAGKTSYIKKYRESTDKRINYINIQKVVANRNNSEFIFEFYNIDKYLDWFVSLLSDDYVGKYDSIIFDDFDFIINLWDDKTLEEFIDTVGRLENSVYPIPFLFIMQAEPIIKEKYNDQNDNFDEYIFNFKTLEAI